jgi:hypothetical protein
MKRTSHSYYVVMIDYGKRGLEAVVDPEITRAGVINRLVSGEYEHVAFIHHVDGLFIEDVTDELFNEAEASLRSAINAGFSRQQAAE